MSSKILGISWLHDRFEAVALTGGAVTGSWASPEPVESEAEFSSALGEAIRQTRFRGIKVRVVVDHRNLLFHVEETPPAKGRVQRQLLDRLVEQNRFFEERAVWGKIELPAAKGRQRCLLALVPEWFVQHLADACAGHGLDLISLVPLAGVLGAQLPELSVPAEEMVVLTAELGGAVQLLLGRGDGQVLFSRTVVIPNAQQSDRTSQEINRTLQYAQQQFGTVVNHLFVFGEKAFVELQQMKIRQGLKVQQSPIPEQPFYAAQQAARLSAGHPLNLVSRAEVHQRRWRQVAAAGLAALLVVSAVTVFQVEKKVQARERQAKVRAERLKAAAERQAAAAGLRREAARLTAFTQLVGGSNDPPFVELFAASLAATLPDVLRLTEVKLARSTNGWVFRMDGFALEEEGKELGRLGQFERRLRVGVFAAKITDSTHQQLVRGEGRAGPSSRRGLKGGRRDEKPFFVTGVIP